MLFALFQLKFAIITPALICGAFAERVRFAAYLLFVTLFSLLIYAPLAHRTWHPDGFLRQWGVLDFAGGTVVHMSAGLAALAGAYVLGRRQSHLAGSALAANATAVLAFATSSPRCGSTSITSSWAWTCRSTAKTTASRCRALDLDGLMA